MSLKTKYAFKKIIFIVLINIEVLLNKLIKIRLIKYYYSNNIIIK
jgi:hypothetical protein